MEAHSERLLHAVLYLACERQQLCARAAAPWWTSASVCWLEMPTAPLRVPFVKPAARNQHGAGSYGRRPLQSRQLVARVITPALSARSRSRLSCCASSTGLGSKETSAAAVRIGRIDQHRLRRPQL